MYITFGVGREIEPKICPKSDGRFWDGLKSSNVFFPKSYPEKNYSKHEVIYYGPFCVFYGPLCINYGPLHINDRPLHINYGPLRKNHEMLHFAYKNTCNEAIFDL